MELFVFASIFAVMVVKLGEAMIRSRANRLTMRDTHRAMLGKDAIAPVLRRRRWLSRKPVAITQTIRVIEDDSAMRRRCDDCAELIRAEAVVCRFCGWRKQVVLDHHPVPLRGRRPTAPLRLVARALPGHRQRQAA